MMKTLRLSCITLLVTPLAAGCGSSPSSPPNPGGGNLPIIFTAGDSTPNSNSITLRLLSATTSSLTLEAVATDVTTVSSVAFDLVFNPSVLSYTSASVGSLFSTAAGNLQFIAEPDMTGSGSGRLVVGIAFVPATSSVSGTGPIATIRFSKVSSGSSAMSFEATGVFKPGPVAAGTTFVGGTARVP